MRALMLAALLCGSVAAAARPNWIQIKPYSSLYLDVDSVKKVGPRITAWISDGVEVKPVAIRCDAWTYSYGGESQRRIMPGSDEDEIGLFVCR